MIREDQENFAAVVEWNRVIADAADNPEHAPAAAQRLNQLDEIMNVTCAKSVTAENAVFDRYFPGQ